MDHQILLSCRDVSLGYEGQPIWEHLDFQVCAGDYVCIVGENGSGKSTLLKSLLGLLKPLHGSITMAPSLASGAIGYLPQQTRAQRDFPATVYEVVLSGFLNGKKHRFFYSSAEKSRALMNLGKLGVLELKDRCYRELSGGQQQRVLLARALCATRKMLLLDEPVSGLDPAASAEMYRIIGRLNREDGVTVVMISHDLQAALDHASHVLYLGQQTFFGTRQAFLETELARRYSTQKGETDHGSNR